MKRNITVNIFGTLYPMDEDAYAMLNAYIVNMRDYFSNQPDGKEIADDIEGRVAELMSELRENGTEAISIQHIEDIINRVGKPEQFIEEDEKCNDPMGPSINETEKKKKLYRDPEHKILGGVFGGFGCYLGITPVWLRLAYILLIFGFLINMPETFPIILLLISSYFVCWASIPLATNPAERLQMKGEQVNLPNMCDEFLTSTREMLSRQAELNKDGRLTAGVVSVLKWCIYAIGILLIAACIAGAIGLLIAIVCAASAPWGTLRSMVGEDFPIMVVIDSNPTWLLWSATVSVLVLLIVTLYLLLHFTLHILGSVRPLTTKLRVGSLVIWLIALLFAAASLTNIASNTISYHRFTKRHLGHKEYNEEERKNEQHRKLNEEGWTIVWDNNTNKLSNKGQHYSGNKYVSYLEGKTEDSGMVMKYEVVRSQKLSPGVYRLQAIGRTNGNGAEIVAFNGKDERYSSPIPVCGNKGGSVWSDARMALEADTTNILPNRNYLNSITKANNSKGYGWSEIVIDNVIVGPDSILKYGVTNVSPTQTWDGTWLSATAFELIRQEQAKP